MTPANAVEEEEQKNAKQQKQKRRDRKGYHLHECVYVYVSPFNSLLFALLFASALLLVAFDDIVVHFETCHPTLIGLIAIPCNTVIATKKRRQGRRS